MTDRINDIVEFLWEHLHEDRRALLASLLGRWLDLTALELQSAIAALRQEPADEHHGVGP